MLRHLILLVLLTFAFGAEAGTLWWQINVDNPYLPGEHPFEEEDSSWIEARLYKSEQLGEWGSVGAAVLSVSYEDIQVLPSIVQEIDSSYKTSGQTFYVELWNDTWAIGRTKDMWNLADYISYDDYQPTGSTMWALTTDDFKAVPEPTGGMLVLLGLVALGLRRRTQKRS